MGFSLSLQSILKKVRKITNVALWAVIGLLIATVVLLRVPTVQQFIGSKTAEVLSEKLGTEVSVGRVDLGFLNRITIDDVDIRDQQGEQLLKASRLSAKIDYLALLKGKIVVTSAQLFGMNANLYQQTADAPHNFQFVLDSLASEEPSETPLDLRIHSLIIRRGSVAYHKRHIAPVSGQFSPDHIEATDISAHAILNALQDDSLNLNLKKLTFNEKSGLRVANLSFKTVANREAAQVSDFTLTTAESDVKISELNATYQHRNDTLDRASLKFNGKLEPSLITLWELAPFTNFGHDIKTPFHIASSFSGTASSVNINSLDIRSADNEFLLSGNGSFSTKSGQAQWLADIHRLTASERSIKTLSKGVELPEEVFRLGDVSFEGRASGTAQNLSATGLLKTDAGNANLTFAKNGQNFNGNLKTDGLNLQRILDNDELGEIATQISIDGQLPTGNQPASALALKAKGSVSRLDFRNYSYNKINLDGTLQNGIFDGKIDVDDPNAQLSAVGKIATKNLAANLTANVRHLNPSALHLSDQWGDATFKFDINADIAGQQLNTANGHVDIENFEMISSERQFAFDKLNLTASDTRDGRSLRLQSDFADVKVEGQYDYETLAQSFTNLVGSKLPTLPGLPKQTQSIRNNFRISANVTDGKWLENLFEIPLTLRQPMHLEGQIDDRNRQMNLEARLPHFIYDDSEYRDAILNITTPNDTLRTHAAIRRISDNGNQLRLTLDANAADNHLATALHFENDALRTMKGVLNTDAQFFKTTDGKDAAHVDIHSSDFTIGNALWTVEPGTIVYSKNDLTIDHLAISSDNQHLIIDGRTTATAADSLIAELQNIDVEYILDLVDFDAVKFSGLATGKAFVTNLFGTPEAAAKLSVADFHFEDGRMGTLSATARLNNEAKQIDINAIANDTIAPLTPGVLQMGLFPVNTLVNGYVSPQRNELELFITPNKARGEFLESFCGSFMRDIDLQVTGNLRLYGPLDDINLTGNAIANGSVGIKSLNTTYTLRNAPITLIPDEILFQNDTIYDAHGHIGIVDGALHHKSLTRLTYDFDIEAQELLAYDFRDFGSDTFCGTVYGTGNCVIRGRDGEVVIDVDVTPDEGSEIRYNASSPDAISSGEFVTWRDRNSGVQEFRSSGVQEFRSSGVRDNSDIQHPTPISHHPSAITQEESPEQSTDIRLNFLINANPRATLKVIMDNNTGDYIALNGDGVLRATYYNKGSFDMFGNYNVDHGIYKLTIQNVIKKDFQFAQGGTIVFGGDPYNAALNLQALYTVVGVPLSDLQLGNSFKSNNIRVNCLMNITGTPNQPRVDFALDMPTVGTDAKQMIFNLINSEQEMNQQVLYLLAVGRFYNQGTNNAAADGTAQQSQTSLAMQSLLSGTISQQLNNVLSSLVKNQNWNFGANISTGDQGFYNAEYEGLLSGRLLNNRLLINGEFGYRDNPNATTSFIGDFDLQYLLRPSGNLAITVYNQTHDRYFTRNSLNTQGVGIIWRKDFNGLRDLLGLPAKKTMPENDSETEPSDSTSVSKSENQE